MRWTSGLGIAAVIVCGLLLAACEQVQSTSGKTNPAAVIEKIAGSEINRVILSEKAMERLDLRTDLVREARLEQAGSPRKFIPYSSLIYDPQGKTWVYTSPEPRTFVRQKIEVDYIEGDRVILKEGPPAGTVVASVGVAELYGAEFEVGH